MFHSYETGKIITDEYRIVIVHIGIHLNNFACMNYVRFLCPSDIKDPEAEHSFLSDKITLLFLIENK